MKKRWIIGCAWRMSVRHSDVGSMESYLIFHSAPGAVTTASKWRLSTARCAPSLMKTSVTISAQRLIDALSGEIADKDSERASTCKPSCTTCWLSRCGRHPHSFIRFVRHLRRLLAG
ncbi:Uncharacterised protein [Ewingella americana]|uniref:Uncharacterized protein n=1 Tax=Ewingella americana TaxID=41202 RepID=A0A377N8K9_9GAMM|nr:Uncharacterised protein [Ewingella americana]